MWELSVKDENVGKKQIKWAKHKKTMVQDKIIVLIYTLIPPKCQWGNQTISNPLQCHATENEMLSAKFNSTFKTITENVNTSQVYLGESWRTCSGEIYVLQSQIIKSPWSCPYTDAARCFQTQFIHLSLLNWAPLTELCNFHHLHHC